MDRLKKKVMKHLRQPRQLPGASQVFMYHQGRMYSIWVLYPDVSHANQGYTGHIMTNGLTLEDTANTIVAGINDGTIQSSGWFHDGLETKITDPLNRWCTRQRSPVSAWWSVCALARHIDELPPLTHINQLYGIHGACVLNVKTTLSIGG